MELATLNFDTYKVVTLLKDKGFTKKQSEGIMEVIQEVTLSGVATKQDVQDVRTEVQEVRNEVSSLKVWFIGLLLGQTIAILGVMFTMFQFFLTQ